MKGHRRAWEGRAGWAPAALCLAAAAVSPAAAAPPEGRIVAPAPGAVLTAGESVEVRWTPLPPGTEEFELLLFLGGATPSVRLTEQLDPQLRRFLWRVPALPSPEARLVIRFNRGEGEESGPSSGRFRIVAPARAAPVALVFRRGEWWAAPADAVLPAVTGRLGRPRGPWGRPDPAAPFAVLRPWQEAVASAAPAQRPEAARAAVRARRRTMPLRPRRPLSVPLRD